jgi:hypothetical protein
MTPAHRARRHGHPSLRDPPSGRSGVDVPHGDAAVAPIGATTTAPQDGLTRAGRADEVRELDLIKAWLAPHVPATIG